MNITPLNTKDGSIEQALKTLCYGYHGAGKTTQAAYYADAYGKGLIISGESGLASVADKDIDYIPFSTFDRPAKEGEYSFKDIVGFVQSPAFKERGYKWVCLDSATELSQRCFADVEAETANSNNNFEKWGIYERKIMAAFKWIRDLPVHVLITALAAEETDDNGKVNFWPMMVQKKVQKLAPALYDNVFCLVRQTSDNDGKLDVVRYVVTDQVKGWHGKSRDPYRRLSPLENTDNITTLLKKISMSEEAYKKSLQEGPTNV